MNVYSVAELFHNIHSNIGSFFGFTCTFLFTGSDVASNYMKYNHSHTRVKEDPLGIYNPVLNHVEYTKNVRKHRNVPNERKTPKQLVDKTKVKLHTRAKHQLTINIQTPRDE